MKRVWFAFLICALAYPLVALLSGTHGAVVGAMMVATFTVTASVIGIPVFAWYRSKNWFKWWQFALGGVVIGIATASPFFAFGRLSDSLGIATIFGALGAVHSVAFWTLAIFKNEHLQHPAMPR